MTALPHDVTSIEKRAAAAAGEVAAAARPASTDREII